MNRIDKTAPHVRVDLDTADSLAAGTMAGPWRIEHELGSGGMGVVYAVVHQTIGKRAALKVPHRQLIGLPGRGDLMLEARVVNRVSHPNIIDIFEVGSLDDGRPYLVMEELHGTSLHQRAFTERLSPDRIIAILLQLADALTAAHREGIVHRDLKLDNVFLIDEAAAPRVPGVKLLDWGIAKVLSSEPDGARERLCVGTPQYLSPEQACGAQVSAKTDVYSLGVIAYELFLDELPFVAGSAVEMMAMHLRLAPLRPSQLWSDIPPALEQLLLDMLEKAPELRPTMSAVAHRLDALRADAVQPRAIVRRGRASSSRWADSRSQDALCDALPSWACTLTAGPTSRGGSVPDGEGAEPRVIVPLRRAGSPRLRPARDAGAPSVARSYPRRGDGAAPATPITISERIGAD